MARLGKAWQGADWPGRLGMDWSGVDWRVSAGMALDTVGIPPYSAGVKTVPKS